jgi:hypothetical protein
MQDTRSPNDADQPQVDAEIPFAPIPKKGASHIPRAKQSYS